MKNEQAIIDGLQEKRAMIECECVSAEKELDRLTSIILEYKERIHAIDKVIAEFDGDGNSDNTLLFGDLSEKPETETSFQKSFIEEQEPLINENTDYAQADKSNQNGNGVYVANDKLITRGRSSNFRNLVREEFGNLPNLFNKKDVINLMENAYPELKGNINTNTMSGVMRSLVKNGFAKIRHKATGTSSQVYEKKV